MQFGYGLVQTLCTWRAIHPPTIGTHRKGRHHPPPADGPASAKSQRLHKGFLRPPNHQPDLDHKQLQVRVRVTELVEPVLVL